jgi:hypothetical protein
MSEDEKDKQDFKEFINNSSTASFTILLQVSYHIAEYLFLEGRRTLREKIKADLFDAEAQIKSLTEGIDKHKATNEYKSSAGIFYWSGDEELYKLRREVGKWLAEKKNMLKHF